MWFQLQIEQCPSDQVEALSNELEALGSLSIMLTDKNDNPVLEPEPGTTPLWPEVIINTLHAQAEEAQHIKAHLAKTWPKLVCTLDVLPDKDWERAWMDDFKPQRFGKRLWICPTWSTPPEPDAVNLMLDPGLAFGTGSHATTSLCLTWLEAADLKDKTLIDYGCGSGILSLAALKLGAQAVHAVDIDNQALQATYNNAQSNQIKDSQLSIGLADTAEGLVDLIIANILLAPLVSLGERFTQLLKPEGLLVVSGLLSEQVPLLISAYESLFTAKTTQHEHGWALIVFSPKA